MASQPETAVRELIQNAHDAIMRRRRVDLAYQGRIGIEQAWTAYDIPWGLLAPDEDAASQQALLWQRRCYPLEPEVLDVSERGSGYEDHPGVVWQGFREGVEPSSSDPNA